MARKEHKQRVFSSSAEKECKQKSQYISVTVSNSESSRMGEGEDDGEEGDFGEVGEKVEEEEEEEDDDDGNDDEDEELRWR